MINPFFSIIIPTYNRENFITSTIQSVINQTFKNWELLIIDDGSTDNTKTIIKNIGDPELNIYTKKMLKEVLQEIMELKILMGNGYAS